MLILKKILKEIKIKENIKLNIIKDIKDIKQNEIITIRINISYLRSEISQLINIISINDIFQNFQGVIYCEIIKDNIKYIITSTKIQFTNDNINLLWNEIYEITIEFIMIIYKIKSSHNIKIEMSYWTFTFNSNTQPNNNIYKDKSTSIKLNYFS